MIFILDFLWWILLSVLPNVQQIDERVDVISTVAVCVPLIFLTSAGPCWNLAGFFRKGVLWLGCPVLANNDIKVLIVLYVCMIRNF